MTPKPTNDQSPAGCVSSYLSTIVAVAVAYFLIRLMIGVRSQAWE